MSKKAVVKDPSEIKNLPAESNIIAECSGLEPQEILQLFAEKNVLHVTQKDSLNFLFDVQIGIQMVEDLNSFVHFPVAHLIGKIDKSQQAEKVVCGLDERLADPKDKGSILDKIRLNSMGLTKQTTLLDEIIIAADELITNAIYNAPFIGLNEAKSGVERDSKSVKIDPQKKPRFFLAANDQQIFIGCTDFYGTLNVPRMLNKIYDCYTRGVEQMIDYESAGAGIGSFRIFDSCSGLYIGVIPGVATTVCCSFARKLSGLKRKSLPKTLHVSISS